MGKLFVVVFFIFNAIQIYAKPNEPQFIGQLQQLSKQHPSSNFSKATRFFLQENWDSTLIYSMQHLHQSRNNYLASYCHYFRGVSFWRKQLPDRALIEFRKIESTFPFYYKVAKHLGDLSLEKRDFTKALRYYNTYKAQFLRLESTLECGHFYHNIGICYFHLEELDSAENNLYLAEAILKKQGDEKGLISTYIDLGNVYYAQYKDQLAISFFKKAYTLSTTISDIELKQNTAFNMAVVEENRNNVTEALRYRKEYESWRDSLNDQNKVWALAEQEKRFAVAQKEKELVVLTTKNAQKNAERNMYILSSVLLFALLVVGVYFYRQKVKNAAIVQLQKNKLDELNATKDKLFSIVSHDMRSSVQVLKASNSDLLNSLETGDFSDLGHQLRQNNAVANSAYNLLDNLLHWSLLQTEQGYFYPEPFDLCTIVEQVIYNYKPLMAIKTISYEQHIERGKLVLADCETFKLILRNLVDNSIKFTPKNGTIRIYVRETTTKYCEIVIEDTGVGISQASITELIKENVLLSKKKHEDILGTGLGLQLCKSMIRKNNGLFAIESTEQVGTKMIVSLLKADHYG
jgi:signal transduction histidine kinase